MILCFPVHVWLFQALIQEASSNKHDDDVCPENVPTIQVVELNNPLHEKANDEQEGSNEKCKKTANNESVQEENKPDQCSDVTSTEHKYKLYEDTKIVKKELELEGHEVQLGMVDVQLEVNEEETKQKDQAVRVKPLHVEDQKGLEQFLHDGERIYHTYS